MAKGQMPAWKAASRARLHRAILDAARVTFGEKGYGSATVEEIAALAEVGKGTVYTYFEGGKPALFEAVVHQHFSDLQRLSAEALREDGGPLRPRLERFIMAFLAYFDAHPYLLRMHLRDVTGLLLADEGEAACAPLRTQRHALVDLLIPPLEAAIARDEVRGLPAAESAQYIFGLLLSHLFHLQMAPATPPPTAQDAASRLTGMIFDGIRRR